MFPDEDGDRLIRRAAFDGNDFLEGCFVTCIGPQSVQAVGGKDDNASGFNDAARLGNNDRFRMLGMNEPMIGFFNG
jgi:hypothetical protein